MQLSNEAIIEMETDELACCIGGAPALSGPPAVVEPPVTAGPLDTLPPVQPVRELPPLFVPVFPRPNWIENFERYGSYLGPDYDHPWDGLGFDGLR